jgi:hypothetical protein
MATVKSLSDDGKADISRSGDDEIFAGLSRVTETKIGDFNAYDFQTRTSFWNYEEYEFYEDYRKMYLQNPWAYMLTTYLHGQIFGDGYHFEGDEEAVKTVEEFWKEDNTELKIETSFLQAIVLGNGFLNLKTKNRGKKLTGTEVMDGEFVRITKTIRNKTEYWVDSSWLLNQTNSMKLREKNIAHFYMRMWPNTPYGMSLLRPNLFLLSSLDDMCNDIPAAIKRMAYSPMVAKLDMDNYESEAEKDAAADAFAKMIHKKQSAVQNYVIDSRHDLGIVGTLGGAGGAGAQLLRVTDLMQPLIAVALINFGMPLGYFLQSGANKAIVREQRLGVRKFLKNSRNSIIRNINKKLIPMLTDGECEVVFDDDVDENVRIRKILMLEYQLGIITREYYHDIANISDDGSKYFEAIGGAGALKARDEYEEPEVEDDTVEDRGD